MVRDQVISKLTDELTDKAAMEMRSGGLQLRKVVETYLNLSYQCALESKAPNGRSSAVVQMDMEGKELKRWDSAREAARYLEVKGHSHILKAAKGIYQTAYGYKWKLYAEQQDAG